METVLYKEEVDSPIIESSIVKPLRQAYVFINTEPESYKYALEDLHKIECVSEIYPAKGAYEIVAKVSGESIDYLREQIFTRIKNLQTIKSTLTLMIVDPQK